MTLAVAIVMGLALVKALRSWVVTRGQAPASTGSPCESEGGCGRLAIADLSA
jgi:hypothetical protein